MENEIRDSGIDIIGKVPWGTHICQFYQTKEDLKYIVTSYLKTGLENNEFCIWMTSRPLDEEEAKAALKEAVPDIDFYLEKGQIEIIPCADWYIKKGVFDPQKALDSLTEKADQSLVNGYDGLRFVENIYWLDNKTRDDFVNYEKGLNSTAGMYPVIALCTYPLEMCSITDIIGIAANHQFILSRNEGKWEKTKNTERKITAECKQAEKALQKSEERYYMLFRHMTDGFGLVEVIYTDNGNPYDYRYLEVNPAFEQYSGVDREQMLGRTMLELFPNVSPIALEKYHDTAISGQPVHFEIFSHVADKHLDIYVFSPEKGKLALVLRDITERKRIEKELHESEERFAVAFGTIPDALVISDTTTGLIVDVNNAWTDHWGYSREESIGHRSAELGIYVNFADRERCMQILRKGGLLHEFDLELRTRKGDLRQAVISTEVLKLQGGQLMLTVIRDITERKKAEETLRHAYEEIKMQSEKLQAQAEEVQKANEALLESEARLQVVVANSPDIIFEQDHNLRYIWIYNPSSPYSSSDVIGKTDADLLPPDQAKQLESIKHRVIDTGRREQVLLQLSPGGEPKWFEAIYEPRYDAAGQITGVLSYTRDVTERKQTEKELKESERQSRALAQSIEVERARLAAILENLPVGVWIADQSGHLTGKNREADRIWAGDAPLLENIEEYTEYTAWYADSCKPLAPEEYPVARALLTGQPIEPIELRILRFDGTTGAVLVSAVPIKDRQGQLMGAVGINLDITRLKQTEKELQESEENYRNIVDTASEGIWIGDAEARTTYVNERLTEMLGYTQEEMIGRFAWDFADEEGKSVVKKNIERRREGFDESYEFKFVRKDGSPLWVIVSSKSLFDKDGKFTGSMSMLTDITRRKEAEDKLKETYENLENLVKKRTAELEEAYSSLEESEKRYRSFIENFKGIAFQADENFIPVFLHGTVEEITGYSEEEFMSRQPWKEIIHPEDLPNIYEEEEKIRNSPYRAYGEIDFRIIRRDGKIKWMHEIYQKIPGNNRTPDKYQGAIYDITERKEAEEALIKMEKIRIKEIHHRIKNNLQVISSLLDLQAETFSKLEACKTSEVIEAFMESQSRVISIALIHEELYAGDKIDSLDFSAYLRKLTAELFISYNPGKKNISFKLNLEQVYLGMDTAIPLGIIVNELVSNSFKHAFCSEKGGEICINLRKNETLASKSETFNFKNDIDGQGKECTGVKDFNYMLEVLDNGKGIPEEIDFENSNSLGLQLVSTLVEQIDGFVELERDQGTKFTIWFNNIEM